MKKYIFRVLPVLALIVLVVYLLPGSKTSFPYHFEKGRPWAYESLTAEFDFPIYKTDAELDAERRELLSQLSPCFTRSQAEKENGKWVNVLSLQDYDRLRREGIARISVVEGHLSTTFSMDEIYTPKTVYKALGRELSPTLTFDSVTTNRMRQNLLSGISLTSGLVQTGEKIIDRGKLVNDRDYQVLDSLRRALEEDSVSKKLHAVNLLGDVVLVILFILLFACYLMVFRPALAQELRNILFFCILPAIVMSMASLEMEFSSLSIYLIPFTWIPILTRIFYDSRTALFLHLTTIFVASIAVPSPYEFLVVQTAAGMVAVASLKDLTHRAQLSRTAGYIFLTYTVVYTGFVFATTGDYRLIDPYCYLYFAINAILVICSYGLIYLFERSFQLLSSITLVELTDINSDLLHELAEKAPGTFQHSMQVSNLATEAAKTIGANSLLVRTGALYHDIGKLAHPEYFTENQQDAHNPLLDLSSQEAAQIVLAHTADGINLARKHHLPEVIMHFISSHHGTSLVRYFYNTAVNNGEKPNEEDFRYPGPKPSTREAAILMLADAVEARSRSLKDISEQSITDMVNDMIDMQIADGQYDNAPISFRDVTQIKQVFIQRLISMNHHRIKYPKLKENE